MGAASGAGGPGRTQLYAMIAVIVIIGGAFAYYYVQASGTISALNGSVTSLRSEVASQEGVIVSKVTLIASLNQTVASLNSDITGLNVEISSDEANITADLTEIGLQQGQISSLNMTVSTLKAQVAQDQVMVAQLTSQVNSLQTEIQSLQRTINLEDTQSILTSQVFLVPGSSCYDVITIPNLHAGFLSINYNSNSANFALLVNEEGGCTSPFADDPTVWLFPSSGSGSASFPIAPEGTGIYIFIVNGATTSISITLTVLQYT